MTPAQSTCIAANTRGFSLVELAIVLVIVSLLAGGMMMTLGSQFDQRNLSDTRQQLQDARDALLGFAVTHRASADQLPYLPCADTNNDGVEDRNADGSCVSAEGNLPWATLATAAQDAWGNRFRYRVAGSYSNSKNGFSLLTPAASLQVCDQAACTSLLASLLPAVIVSHGKNGFGATNAAGGVNTAPSSVDEQQNSNGDNTFVSHTPTPPGANEFDDLVIWLSPNILYNRMIAAGRLP